jgi:hypothetical protein
MLSLRDNFDVPASGQGKAGGKFQPNRYRNIAGVSSKSHQLSTMIQILAAF